MSTTARPTLTELAERYSCDKLHNHSYVPWYEREFERFRNQPIRVLEIGIGYKDLMRPFVPRYVHGASLKMWRDWFSNAYINGCDVRRETLFDDSRIYTFELDQTCPLDLWAVSNNYMIIIDDGSHEPAHQILTAAVLYPKLRMGGVYVIEDVREPERVSDALGGEIVRFNKRPDDCLVVLRK